MPAHKRNGAWAMDVKKETDEAKRRFDALTNIDWTYTAEANPNPRKRRRDSPSRGQLKPRDTTECKVKTLEFANQQTDERFQALYLPLQSALWSFTPRASDESFYIALQKAATLTGPEFDSCFSLIEETSSAAYRSSSAGWHPTAKKREMRDNDMRYLVVRDRPPGGRGAPIAAGCLCDSAVRLDLASAKFKSKASAILGFLSFMPTFESDYFVLYIYELHLVPSVRRLGLGAHLMRMTERVARAIGVDKIMLTVFSSNTEGEAFYRRLGYSDDEICPPERKLRRRVVIPPEYRILSKRVSPDPK